MAESLDTASAGGRLVITIMAAVTSLIFGMTPGLGGLIGAGETVRGARVRNETMSMAWLLATVAGAGVVVWDRTFIGLWVSEKYYPGLLSTVLIVLMVLQFSLIRVDSNIIDLTLNLRTKVLLGLFSAALSVALAWVLVSHFQLGIPGVVIGFMAGRAVQSFTYPVMVGRIPEQRSEQGDAGQGDMGTRGKTTAGCLSPCLLVPMSPCPLDELA